MVCRGAESQGTAQPATCLAGGDRRAIYPRRIAVAEDFRTAAESTCLGKLAENIG